MKERGGVLAAFLTALLLFFWLRFFFHADARFPGSLLGSGLAIAGSLLMLVPLAYTVAKRVFGVRGPSLRTFLAWHIYAALVGSILVMLHTGHKFDNPLGVLLTAMMLVVVLSGFVGRYLLQRAARHLAGERDELGRSQAAFAAARDELARCAERVGVRRARRSLMLGAMLPWPVRDRDLCEAGTRAVNLADAVAVLETSVAMHDRVQRWFRLWMRFHLTLTAVFYLLLVGHVFSVSYYGLRWLPE